MTEKNKKASSGDRAIGMDASITRRDFLGSALLASGASALNGLNPAQILATAGAFSAADAQADWTGYGGVGEYSRSNGNAFAVMEVGHKMRDGAYEPLPPDTIETGETYDCVIVGGGISGLAAALFFQRKAGKDKTCLILENHPIFGGEAKQNEFEVDGKRLVAHQGSAIYLVPYPYSFIARFYDSIGLHTPKLTYQRWSGTGPEMTLGRTPYDSAGLSHGQYGFWFGAEFGQDPGLWLVDPVGKKMEGAPLSPAARRELLRWFSGAAADESKFDPPKYEGDEISRKLDAISLEQHMMERYGLSRETIRTFLSPVEGGGSGLGPDALSAFSEYAADLLHPWDDGSGEVVQMFPGGNTTIARLMVKALLPGSIDGPEGVEGVSRGAVNFAALDARGSTARVRLSSTAVSVRHDGDPAKASALSIAYAKDGKVFSVKARSAVMAGGSWTAKHIIKDLPEAQRSAYAQFYRSPCMMANVAVRNWRFLQKMGITGCRWFRGIGNYFDVRRQAVCGGVEPTITPDAPIVLTLKVLYSYPGYSTEEQGHRGRGEMITTPFREYERRIRQQFTDMFRAAGFRAEQDIAGIVLNRWGHAYLTPQPGFFFGSNGQRAPRDVLRAAPFGRIAFANTDLAGAMDHRYSILEAHRAVGQLLDQVVSREA
ncbi:MAG TPA: NAD(P)-binding protein [Candidatus Cybelea sp.]|jgi:spermidine dehydrogenase|nr:NAD(P)-binding protein [Candidatus Cybelea sp.]